MKKIFITSTGTEVGKTILTSSLIKKLKQKNKVLKFQKPVISGFDSDIFPNDLSLLCEAAGIEYSSAKINEISLYKFTNPLSPDQASEVENKPINFDDLVKFCTPDIDVEYLLVEGIGGHQVPLTKKHTILDLIKSVKAEINILVSGSYLGCLSHTISAIKNFESEGITIDVLVVTENLNKDDKLYINSSATIKSLRSFYSGNILEIKHKDGSFDEITNSIAKEINYDF